jgi:hypothetical protein
MKDNKINSMYFYPYLAFTVLIILPLPVAIIFEAFKINRSKILLNDRLQEKEGLFMAFLCIDFERRGYINQDQWLGFVKTVYGGNHDIRKSKRVFESLDTRDIGYMVSYGFTLELREIFPSMRDH